MAKSGIRPFTAEQVEAANRVFGDWWFYYHGGHHKWRVYSEEGGCPDPTLWGKPIYEKPGPEHFLRFIHEVVWTLDEDDPENPLKEFPKHKSYIEYYTREVLFKQRFIVIPKSRRLMMTWINACYALWFALTHQRRNIIWQAQKGEKVADTMENKILHMLKHLPRNRYAPFVDVNTRDVPAGWDERVVNWYKGKRESYGLTRVMFLMREKYLAGEGVLIPSSRIFGVPEGEDQTRQFTITLFIGDEFAFWSNPRASLKGVRPALGKHGQGILISSAAPGYMQELIERPEEQPGQESAPQPTPIHEGIKTWYSTRGWFVFWVHYTADEEKRDHQWTEWFDISKGEVKPGDPGYARLGIGRQEWEQEYEISFSVHKGTPFYPEYTDALHLHPVRAIPGQPLMIGVDFGLTPSFVICQAVTSGHLNVLDEIVFEDNGIEGACEEVVQHLDLNYPWWRGRKGQRNWRDPSYTEEDDGGYTPDMLTSYVDPAGNRRSEVDLRDAIGILKANGLNPVPSIQSPVQRSEAVKDLLTRVVRYPSRKLTLPRLLFNPKAKLTIEGMRGGAKIGKTRFNKEKNEFSHPIDALEYVAVQLVNFDKKHLRRREIEKKLSMPHVQKPSGY